MLLLARNKRRDKAAAATGGGDIDLEGEDAVDMTDFEVRDPTLPNYMTIETDFY